MDMAWLADNKAMVVVYLFLLFVVWEARVPVSSRTTPYSKRWLINYALYLVTYGVWITLNAIPTLWGAHWASMSDFGLFNLIVAPIWLQCIVALLAFDLAAYCNHRLMHHFSFLWRFHQLHHSDRDVDLTTGFRFHPVESCLSLSLHIAVVVLLGLSPVSVLFYWLILVFSNYFVHANIRITESTDHLLLQLFVTPSMHRLHHSSDPQDRYNNYNFGGLVTIWDRLMKTYKLAGTLEEQSRQTFGIYTQEA
jgi:sterol desaturase/sphingolipid hydroxylase (fatty acid hydroxylase superfamily)